MSIQLQHIHKHYDKLVIYRDFSLALPDKTISCILGPSGCGKTSLLNMIGGITSQDGGDIKGVENKKISFIFQEPRLLPWKTVRGNLDFVLRHQDAHDKEKAIDNNLILVGLQDFAHYYPEQLSGGMKQRVAIARAFSYPSDLILMDEPLKTLDPRLKWNLMRTFLRLWENDRRTVVFVTHDVDEALVLGEEIFVFSRPPVQVISHITNPLERGQKNLDNRAFFEQKQNIMRQLD